MDKETLRNAAFPEQDPSLFDKKVTPVAVPQHEIGIDLDNHVLDNITETMETSQFDINALNSFTQVSRSRNEIYEKNKYFYHLFRARFMVHARV